MKYGAVSQKGRGPAGRCAFRVCPGCLVLDAFRGTSQAFGRGIMTDGIESTPELFIQVVPDYNGLPENPGLASGPPHRPRGRRFYPLDLPAPPPG